MILSFSIFGHANFQNSMNENECVRCCKQWHCICIGLSYYFFNQTHREKFMKEINFLFFLHLVEMLLLPVHENRQLGVLFKFHDHVWYLSLILTTVTANLRVLAYRILMKRKLEASGVILVSSRWTRTRLMTKIPTK
jgi:hypothetical protein